MPTSPITTASPGHAPWHDVQADPAPAPNSLVWVYLNTPSDLAGVVLATYVEGRWLSPSHDVEYRVCAWRHVRMEMCPRAPVRRWVDPDE